MSVTANLTMTLFVECPSCSADIDLFKQQDLNDEAQLYNSAISDKAWQTPADERIDLDCDCPECFHTFHVKGVYW